MASFAERLAAIRGSAFESRLAEVRSPDVRTQIAERQANPPLAAKGDPTASPETALETYFPAAAHPVEAAKGLANALNPLPILADPVGTAKSVLEQRQAAAGRVAANPIPNDLYSAGQELRDLYELAVPVVGTGLANAGRAMESPNAAERARGMGEAIGITSGPKLAGRVGDIAAKGLKSRAVNQYAKVFGKSADATEAKATAAGLVRDRVRSVNPNEDLAALGERRAKAGDTKLNAAIAGMDEPIKAEPILDRIDRSRLSQYNQVPLDDTGTVSLAENGPDAAAMVNYLQKYAENISKNADPTGNITPENALNLKRAYDLKPGQRGAYSGKDVTSADVAARAEVANAMRPELNADPNVASANRQINSALKLKTLAENAPTNKALITPWESGRIIAGGLFYPFSHGAGAFIEATAAVPLLYRTITSPAWRTASAIAKDMTAEAIRNGDYRGAAEIAVRASQPVDKDELNRRAAEALIRRHQ